MELLSSIFTLSTAQTALELGCVYALVALALFLSYSILNIADLSTDGCFTLGCAVCCQVTLMGHPVPGAAGGDGCGRAFRLHHRVFADAAGRGEHPGGHHRQYRPLHHQP